jgi:tripartite-type tricarboxylate transporter receptor subunit TctC
MYPEKPVTMVVGYPPGGATDVSARITADALSRVLRQPVTVLNKPGAAGAVAAAFVKNARPDGYTLLYTGSGPILVQPHVEKTAYDALNDFRYVGQVTIFHAALGAAVDSPYKTGEDLIKWLHEKPEPLTIGMNGGPNMAWIGLASLLNEARVDRKKVNLVPFEGDAPALAALMGGHCTVIAANHSVMKPQADAGKIRILGVFSGKRPECDPSTPTFKEMGYNVDIPSRFFIAAPAGVPEQVVNMLESSLKKVVETESFRTKILSAFQDPKYLNSEDLTVIIRREYELYGHILGSLKGE